MVSTNRRQGVNASMAIKVPCITASTTNLTLSGEQTVDGIALVAGDRCFVKDQTDGTENGIYDVDTSAWTRSPDFDGAFDVVEGTVVPVSRGTTNSQGAWRVSNTGAITIGTTSITFSAAGVNDSSLVTFNPSGGTATTVQEKLREYVSVSDYAGSLTDAITAIGATETTLLIDAAISLGSNATVPATMTLRFVRGAIITIATGVTLTVNSQVEAGPYHIFIYSGTGVVTFPLTQVMSAGWWASYTTDAGTCITNAFRAIKNIGGVVTLPPGAATSTTTVDITDYANQFYRLEGSVGGNSGVTFATAGFCFDCTGSNRLTFRDFRILGDTSTVPTVGFFFARQASAGNALFHYMYNVISQGQFSKAVVYSYAAEECRYFNCYFHNNDTVGCGFWITSDNDGSGEDLTSSITTTATGVQSNSDNLLYGCSWLNSGVGGATADNIKIRGVSNFHIIGAFFANNGSSTAPRSHVYIDASSAAALNAYFSFSKFRSEDGTNVQYGFYINGTQTVSQLSITDGFVSGSANPLLQADAGKLNALRWNNVSNTTGGATDVDIYTLEFSDVKELGNLAIRNNLTNSVLAARSTLLTITGAITDSSYFDMDTGNTLSVATPTTLADDATPTVKYGHRFLTGGTTTITDFDDGVEGQEIVILSEHAITITDGTNIFLAGSVNFVMAATGSLTLVQKADGKWYEISRSVN